MNVTMKAKFFVLFFGLVAAGTATNVVANNFELPAAKVTVRVVDENEKPLVNANVWLSFKDRLTRNDKNVRGFTDVEGLFTGEGGCDISGIGCGITKEGYYSGGAPIPKFHELDEVQNRWKPWNETYTVTLRSINKPIALYAKTVHTQIPALNQPCGYDLEKGDWVSPYGNGITKDFIFTVHQEWRDSYDYDLQGEITFRNPSDGVQNVPEPVVRYSEFKWTREAPISGYESKQELRNAWFSSSSGKKPIRSFKSPDVWDGYFFRVRTVEQNGQIVSAHYGKIRGGIAIYPNGPKPKIVFTYYFNPTTLDQNLEWTRNKIYLVV